MKRIISVFMLVVSAVFAGPPVSFVYGIFGLSRNVGTFTIGMEGDRMDSLSGIRVGNIVSLTQWLSIEFDPQAGGIRREYARNLFNGKMQTCLIERKGDAVHLAWTPSGKTEKRDLKPGEPFYTLNAFLKTLYDNAVEPGRVYPVLLEPRMLYMTKSNISATNYRLRSSDNTVNVDVDFRRQKDGSLLPLRIMVSRYIYLGFNWSILKPRLELRE